MGQWLARLRYALHRHGPVGFIRLTGYNLAYYILRRDCNVGRPSYPDVFDVKYGTNTSGVREIGTLDVVNAPAARYAVRYDPSSPELVRIQLAKLEIDYRCFTFIDFGSGKGRVLMVAAGFPFKEVIGVEFSRELHDVAVKNITRLPRSETRAGGIRSIHCDAGTYQLPQSDLVCYFYNPFAPPVMTAVVARLTALHARCGYRIIVIYVDPQYAEIFEKTAKFVALGKAPDVLVLTTDEGAASGALAAR